MTSLTSKQHRVLDAIEKHTATHGHPPSYRELMTELGYQSTGSIYRFVKALQSKGALEKTPRSWRNAKPARAARNEGSTLDVEVIGQISRQHPPALFPKTTSVVVPSHLVSQHGPVYGLVIQDASFLDEHLLPGDLILVEPADTIEPGELSLPRPAILSLAISLTKAAPSGFAQAPMRRAALLRASPRRPTTPRCGVSSSV